MMDICTEIRERFDDWLEDCLSDTDRTPIEGHLKACDACRRFFDYHDALANDLMALDRAADRIAAGRTAAKPVSRHKIGVLQIAAVIVLFIVPGMIIKRVWFDQVGQPITVVSEDPRDPVSQDSTGPDHRTAQTTDRFEFQFSHDDNRLAVRMKSHNPRIHIVWLYDTIPQLDNTDVEAEEPVSDSTG